MSATRNSKTQPDLHSTESTTAGSDAQQTVNTVIIHSDGSYQRNGDLSGVGFTLETNSGDILQEQWREAPNATTSMEAEAAAALFAIQEAKKYSPSFIMLYSDCKPLVDRIDDIEQSTAVKSVYQRIRKEIKEVEITNTSHIDRERNKRADELAHRALRELREEPTTGLLPLD